MSLCPHASCLSWSGLLCGARKPYLSPVELFRYQSSCKADPRVAIATQEQPIGQQSLDCGPLES